ncbi:MAG: hypothetical protein RJA70_2854 [Pseudomonadota bacterium]|jgi:DNA polymerase-3 subunit delta
MSPEQAITAAANGDLRPVYLLLGEERLLRDQVVAKLRAAALDGAIPGLNEDDFQAGEANASSIVGAAHTLPMMGRRRWVLVRGLERWESKKSSGDDIPGDDAKDDKASQQKAETGSKLELRQDPLDQLANYCQSPSVSTVLVLLASSLNGRRRLVTLANKEGFLVSCEPLRKNELPGWVRAAAKRRGCTLSSAAAELIAEVSGPDLSSVEDAVERLSLFVGAGHEITEDAVSELLTIVRPATVWELVDALARRDTASALALVGKVYDPRDRGLKLLSVITWSTRQLLKFQAARASGLDPSAAARAAGAPPFKASSMDQQAKRISRESLESWILSLRDVDGMLKGNSRRPAKAILEAAVIDLCRTP